MFFKLLCNGEKIISDDKKIYEISENKYNIPISIKKTWPEIPKPLPDEIFSSWITRISHANLNSLRSLLNHYKISIPKKDIDLYQNSTLINLFCEKSGLLIKDIKDLMLQTSRKSITIYESKKPKAMQFTIDQWFTNLNRRNDPKLMNSIRYCPHCLKTDNIPYFRKEWKFSYNTFCSKHGCLLENKCQHCGKAFSIWDLAWDANLSYCSNCNNLLFSHSKTNFEIDIAIIRIRKEFFDENNRKNSEIYWILNFAYFLYKNFNSWNYPEIQRIQQKYPKLFNFLLSHQNQIHYNKLQFLADIEVNFYYTSFVIILSKEFDYTMKIVKKFLLQYFLYKNFFQKTEYYYCPLDNCSVRYKEIDKVFFHLIRELSRKKNPQYQCLKCMKRFHEEEDLKKHEIIHTDENAFWCLKCDFPIAFSTIDAFNDHKRIHNFRKPQKIKCKYCNRPFSSDFMLKKHILWNH